MVRIGDIITQNPWWKLGRDFVRYDPDFKKAGPVFFNRRRIEFKRGDIYLFRGPRQAGKTTYFKAIIKELIERNVAPNHILYLSLDLFHSRREMRNAIDYFINSNVDAPEMFFFFDEVTSIDGWNFELKSMADKGITQKGIVLATGSSPIKLKEKGELMPGRGIEGNEYYIKPLSFREFIVQSVDWIERYLQGPEEFLNALRKLSALLRDCFIDLSWDMEDIRKAAQKIIPFKREISYFFEIYLMTGGFPGVINHYFSNRYLNDKNFIAPQMSEVFIRDVLGDLSRLQKQEIIARQILKAIVERYGSRFSISNLSREIERSHPTTMEYLECLEDAFICFTLYPYDFNKKTPRLKGEKKVYFFDPMVYHSIKSYLKGEEFWHTITGTKEDEALQGKIVEGVVLSHLIMHREIPFLRNPITFLWYYYDKSGKEIDAIFKNDGYWGVEIKYKSEVNEKDIKRLNPVKKYIVLSKESAGGDGEVIIIPVDVFLSLLPPSEKNV